MSARMLWTAPPLADLGHSINQMRTFLTGTSSAKGIMASGPCATPKGRTHGWTDHCCKREESSCQRGAVHTWPIAGMGLRASRQF